MIVKVLGMGCPNCKKFEQNIQTALKELNIETKVHKIEDIQEIMSYGIMSTPALMIDDSIVSAGQMLGVDEIKKIIMNDDKTSNKDNCDSTCCNECH